jgi:Protein of unknown function (DUF1574)
MLLVVVLHFVPIHLFRTNLRLRDASYADRAALLTRQIAAAKDTKPAVVVMVGTSRTGHGFHARQMQELWTDAADSPVVAFNFGIAGSGPIMQQIYVRRLLHGGVKPDLVILEVLPSAFTEREDTPIEYWLMDPARMSPEEMEILSNYGIASASCEKRWREIYLNPWTELRYQLLNCIRPSLLPKDLLIKWNSRTDAWGWFPVEIPILTKEAADGLLDRAYQEHGRGLPFLMLGRHSVQALIDTLELCRAEGIRTVVIHLPEGPSFRAWYPSGKKQAIADAFARIVGEHGAHWIDATEWLPDSCFFDGHHLLKHGAVLFTDRLTSECRERFPEVGVRSR